MILDTSVIIAVIQEEPNHMMLLGKLQAAETIGVGTPTLVEVGLVLGSRLANAEVILAAFLELHNVYPIAFGEQHWREATTAFLRFGRHPAKLNFGDCLSYATAKVANKPLLYVGDDFAQTDIARA